MRACPVHGQAGGSHGTRQGDLKRVRTVLATWNRDRAAALPQRRGLGCIHPGHARTGGAVQRLQFEDRHAPVRRALRARQAEVAGLARREVERLDTAERIAHGVSRLPLLAVQRGLQAVALGIGNVPGDLRAAERARRAQIHLEPVPGAEGAAGHRLRVAIDQVADRHRRHLLRGTAGLPLAARRQGLGGGAEAQRERGEEQGTGHDAARPVHNN
ncbi:hypothetical protein D3C71_1251190 [compost metagenome]